MSQSSETSSEVVSRAGSYEVAKEQGTKYRRRVSEMVQNHQEVVTHIIQDEDPPEQKRRLQQSWKFEAFFAAVLVSNAIFLGVQTEWTSQNLHAAVPTAFTALQLVYAVLFILEIILRIFTSGIRGRKNSWMKPEEKEPFGFNFKQVPFQKRGKDLELKLMCLALWGQATFVLRIGPGIY